MIHCLVCLGLGTATVAAGVYSPRVRVAGAPDTLSLATWARDLGGPEVTNRDFALRLLDQVGDPTSGMRLVSSGPSEGADKLADFARVTDPLKLWHVYGYGDESQIATVFVALWEASGRGRGRLVRIGNSPHCFAEIEAGGRWWAFDVVRHSAFPVGDHEFASMTDLQTQESHWQQTRGTRFYAATDPVPLRQLLSAGPLPLQYDSYAAGHTADFRLRRGERFIRYFRPEGRRWLLTATQLKDKPLLEELEREPAGPKAADNRALHANGQFIYQPTLSEVSGHFADGMVVSDNVQIGPEGLTVIKEGTGSAVFEVRSPYVIVPELGQLADAKDDRDASVVEIDAEKVTLSYSLDNAATWISLETKEWPARIDLTPQVAGTYGYLLRLELKGKPNEALVRSLKLTTWVQLAPQALPAVLSGRNQFQVLTGDEYGLPTRFFAVPASTADENGFLAPVIRPPREYRPGDPQQRVIGPFTFRIAPPLGTKLSWFSYGGRFAIPRARPDESLAVLGYSLGAPSAFAATPVDPLPLDHAGADRQIDRRVRLTAPVSAAYGMMEARPALNELRLVTHGSDEIPRARSDWNVIHSWISGDQSPEHTTVITADSQEYAVEAGENVVNRAIEYRRD